MDAAASCLRVGDDINQFLEGNTEGFRGAGNIDEEEDGDSKKWKGL